MIKEVTRNRQWETTGFSGMNTRRGDPPRTEKELPEEQLVKDRTGKGSQAKEGRGQFKDGC